MSHKINLSPKPIEGSNPAHPRLPSKTDSATLPLFTKLEALAQGVEKQQSLTERATLLPTKRKAEEVDSFDAKQERITSSPQKKLKTAMSEISDLSVAGMDAKVALPPPPKPTKKSRSSRISPTSPYEQLYSDVNTSLSLIIRGSQATLTPFAKGTFMASYAIEAPQEFIPSIPNNQLLVKLYHGELTKFTPHLSEYMQNSITNYLAIQELEIPVSTIYNKETALQDLYFLVERIPHAVDVNQDHQLEQIATLFQQSFQKHILMDLAYNNLRVKDDGTVVLIDFVEKPFDFNNSKKLRMFVIQFLKSWCENRTKTEAEKLLNRFTQGLEKFGFDPSWNQAALDACFIEVHS